jgi:hypothetical protein
MNNPLIEMIFFNFLRRSDPAKISISDWDMLQLYLVGNIYYIK